MKPSYSRTPPAILIADDDFGFRETVCSVLEPRGFRAVTAADGEQALHIVQAEPIHLVLMDMHMPRLTGLETVRILRKSHSDLPCVLLSAGLDPTIVDQARHADVFKVLAKPVTRKEITSTVDQVFRRIYGWP